jgi:hypothetical protein
LLVATIAAASAFGGSTITGTVPDAQGASVGSAVIRLSPIGSGETKYRGESDREGKFKIEGIAPGEYFIRASAQGFRESSMRVSVDEGTAELGTVKLPVIDCDGPGVNCDYIYPANSTPSPSDVTSAGRVTLRFDAGHADFKLTTNGSGSIYLNPINGTTIGPCEGKPTPDPIRIDGLGPGNDWCAITHDKHRAHVFITGGIVEPGVLQVPLWIVMRK